MVTQLAFQIKKHQMGVYFVADHEGGAWTNRGGSQDGQTAGLSGRDWPQGNLNRQGRGVHDGWRWARPRLGPVQLIDTGAALAMGRRLGQTRVPLELEPASDCQWPCKAAA